MEDPAKLVQSIPLFATLEPEARALIARLIRVRRYSARQALFWEGEAGGALFVALSGYLKAVTSGAEGKEVLLNVMGPGEVIGELSVLDGQPRSASVIALESCQLATIEREPLLSVMRASPNLAIALVEVLAQRLRTLSKRHENISSMDISSRLADVILTLAEKHGERADGGVRLPMRLSQQDLGAMVGATRESVNKQLRHWIQDGILKQESGRVIITNFEALRSLAAPS
jgi:CRP/FNR family transcriptional regulator, cyclic AMP receptor protein